MEPRKLFHALLDKAQLSVNMLAAKAEVGQPQLHKFYTGATREPRRSTMQPVADYFRVPVEAFYDAEVAGQVAADLGIGPGTHNVRDSANEPRAIAKPPKLHWPFKAVAYSRLRELPAHAIQDIDRTLDILVTRWEQELLQKKRRPSR